jgi:threonine dehydrogenase-like Zn-dependent dehydrogenase
LVVDEVRIVGSRCGPFEPAIAALAQGTIDPRPLIETVYPLSRGIEAFEHAARPGTLKVLLDPRRG